MKQFHETYAGDEKLSALLRELPWTHNLLILSKSKSDKEREFYLHLSIREHYSSRELERQIDSGLFERTVLSPAKVSPAVTQIHPEAGQVFKDTGKLSFYLEALDRNVRKKPGRKLLIQKLHEFYDLEYGASHEPKTGQKKKNKG